MRGIVSFLSQGPLLTPWSHMDYFYGTILLSRGHQVQSWRAGVPAEFSSNPNQTHLKQLNKVLLGILETSRQVC